MVCVSGDSVEPNCSVILPLLAPSPNFPASKKDSVLVIVLGDTPEGSCTDVFNDENTTGGKEREVRTCRLE